MFEPSFPNFFQLFFGGRFSFICLMTIETHYQPYTLPHSQLEIKIVSFHQSIATLKHCSLIDTTSTEMRIHELGHTSLARELPIAQRVIQTAP